MTGQADIALFESPRTVAAGVTLSVVAIATFLLLPPFIEAAVTDLHYTEGQVGILSALIMGGSTVASVGASLWVRRTSWRGAALLALLGLLIANVASMFCHGLAPFLALQSVGGFCGGSLYSLSLTVLSDGARPNRGFAYAVGAQTLYQVFGLVAGPFLLRHGGMNTILGLFSILCIAGALIVGFLPRHGRIAMTRVTGAALLSAPVAFALAGCFLFYVNINAYWTYIERIGTTAGLDLGAVSNSLAFGTVASMGGVVLAAWLGERCGLIVPIGVSAIAIVVAMMLLTGTLHLMPYVLSSVIYGNAWNLSITYQYSTVNVVDASRRGVALAPAFHNAGGAAGPAIAALFVREHDHGSVIWLVSISVVASLGCFWTAKRLHATAANRLLFCKL
ncbi:MAG TPA: MFS transporter [Steroidobacteraceae bacterium]|nr:MFS transporter [Steroidobacteraceae bacterium]